MLRFSEPIDCVVLDYNLFSPSFRLVRWHLTRRREGLIRGRLDGWVSRLVSGSMHGWLEGFFFPWPKHVDNFNISGSS
jgi:hypothetical protein